MLKYSTFDIQDGDKLLKVGLSNIFSNINLSNRTYELKYQLDMNVLAAYCRTLNIGDCYYSYDDDGNIYAIMVERDDDRIIIRKTNNGYIFEVNE